MKSFVFLVFATMCAPGVYAQTCTIDSGTPGLVRSAGIAEKLGDLLLACTGGSGTNTVSVTVSLNVPVTSRAYEPILLIGEPSGTDVKPGINLFQAASVTGNEVKFTGIPFTAPGARSVLVLRIANLRGDASTIGASSSGLPSAVTASVSSDGLVVNNPVQKIGFVQNGLLTDLRLPETGLVPNACSGNNQALATNASAAGGHIDFAVRFRETFTYAFASRRAEKDQNSPGSSFNTESGFFDTTLPSTNNLNKLGLADSGTRLILRFSNVPAGAKVYVTTQDLSINPLLRLIASDGSPISATSTATWNGQPVSIAAVDASLPVQWEVTNPSQANILDTALVGVVLAYQGAVSVAPAPSVTGSLGPEKATGLVPRFVNSADASLALPIQSCVAGVDLLVSGVSGLPTFWGTTSKTNIAIANRGTSPSGPFTVSVRLLNASDSNKTEEARLDVPVEGLAGGETRVLTTRFRTAMRMPLSVNAVVTIDAGQVTSDVDRSNNQLTASTTSVYCGFDLKGNIAASALEGGYFINTVLSRCMPALTLYTDEGAVWNGWPWLLTGPDNLFLRANNTDFRRAAFGNDYWTGGWLQIQQASIDVGCTTTLASGDLSTAPATGTTRNLSIQASAPTCKWTAVSNVKAAAPTADRQTGSQTIALKVRPNFSTSPRSIPVAAGTWSGVLQQAGNSRPLNERIVQLIYYYFLNRLPREDEITLQVNGMKGLDLEDFIQRFLTTEEFSINSRFVAGLYVGLLTRDPEFNGFQHQRDALTTSAATQEQLIANFLNSPEYALRFGTPSDADYVKLLYNNVLLRVPRQDEIDLQINAMKNGTSRVRLAGNFLNSPEFRISVGPRLTAFLLYNSVFGRDAAPAELKGAQDRLKAGVPASTLLEELVGTAEFGAAIQ